MKLSNGLQRSMNLIFTRMKKKLLINTIFSIANTSNENKISRMKEF